jgi:hypothetical protein
MLCEVFRFSIEKVVMQDEDGWDDMVTIVQYLPFSIVGTS